MIAPETPQRERQDQVVCPVLVIVGTLDMPDALASAETLMARLPQAEWVEIAGVAHLPSLEQPAAFAQALDELYRPALGGALSCLYTGVMYSPAAQPRP